MSANDAGLPPAGSSCPLLYGDRKKSKDGGVAAAAWLHVELKGFSFIDGLVRF